MRIAAMRWPGPALGLTLMAIAIAPAAAQPVDCLGPVKDPHPIGPFNFESNSRLDPMAFGEYRFGITSCVKNNDTANPLYVRWLIPGPHGWVPSRQTLESAPRLSKDDKVVQMKGCLQYGNRGDTTHGLFFGTEADKSRIDDEGKRGCRAAASQPQTAGSDILGNILLRIRNFFPSDATRPQATMLQLDGTVAIEAAGQTRYTSIFTYRVTRYQSDGSPSDVTLLPVFRGGAEALLPAFRKSNGPASRLGGDGRIAFEVVEVGNPQLVYASYEFRDREGRVVGSIDFPVFVSRR